MGFDTALNVGGRQLDSWRKQRSSLPRLLFRYEDAVVKKRRKKRIEVVYRSTVADVLQTMQQNGLGWDATVAAYETFRVGHHSEASLFGELMVKDESLSRDDIEKEIEKFRREPAVVDLEIIGSLMAEDWKRGVDDVIVIEDLLWEESSDVRAGMVWHLYSRLEKRTPRHRQALRAIETLAVLTREAPLLAWPMIVAVLLKHLPHDAIVEYDVTDHAFEYDVRDAAGGRAYVEENWAAEATYLGTYAAKLGSLFNVLGAFESRLGREFAFAQAATALARLDSQRSRGASVSTKERGDAFETLVDSLIRAESELTLVAKNFRTREEEIDLLLANGLSHPFWVAHGSPFVLIECKNWTTKVGVQELRVLESKMIDRGAVARIGIFASMSGFTEPFRDRLKQIQGVNGIIFALEGSDVRSLITNKRLLSDYLRTDGLVRALGR